MIPTNLATRMTSIERGGQGPYFVPQGNLIGQQLTNTTGDWGRCMGDNLVVVLEFWILE